MDCRVVYSPHQSDVDIQFIQKERIVCSALTADSYHLPLAYQVRRVLPLIQTIRIILKIMQVNMILNFDIVYILSWFHIYQLGT